MHVRRGDGDRPLLPTLGGYDDELIREDGRWRFLRRGSVSPLGAGRMTAPRRRIASELLRGERRADRARRRPRRADGAPRPALPADGRRGGRGDAHHGRSGGLPDVMMVADEADVALLRRKAVEFLRALPRRRRRAARDRARGAAAPQHPARPGRGARRRGVRVLPRGARAGPVGAHARRGASRRRRAPRGLLGDGHRRRVRRAERRGDAQARRHPVHGHREGLRRRRHLVGDALSRARAWTPRAAPTRTSSARTSPYSSPFCDCGGEPALLRLGRRHLRAARRHRLRHRGARAHAGTRRRRSGRSRSTGPEGGARCARTRWSPRSASSTARGSPRSRAWQTSAGRSWHTSRWPEDADVAGKRVAVIGTGCTGYQLIPELALQTEHVVAFQRTPQWLFGVPGYLSPFPRGGDLARPQPPLLHELHAAAHARHRQGVHAHDRDRPGLRRSARGQRAQQGRRARRRSSSCTRKVADPELRATMTPHAPAVVGARGGGRHATTACSTRSSATT